jgi:hypothetical protein
VTGPIPANVLGPTLAHEHLYSDFAVFSGKPDNHFTVPSAVIDELVWFRQAGGRSIVEVAPEGTGRDPVRLREISLASGVQVISGIAFYEESTYPDWVREASVEQIADFFVFHLEEGHAGVRAGAIGELTSHNEDAPNPSGYRLSKRGVIIALASLALCWLVYATAVNAWNNRNLVTFLFLAVTFLAGLFQVSMFALFMGACSPVVAATQFSAYMALLNVSSGYGSKFAGHVGEQTDLTHVFFGLACFQLAMILPVAFIRGDSTSSTIEVPHVSSNR